MISIITITYNNFKELKRTLSSIPDYEFIESVVINGGSDDASKEYLSSHQGKVINEKDEGIADAFNKGIANSSDDAIMFLNSGDELIEATYLREAEELLKKNNTVDFIHSNLVVTDQTGLELYMKPPFYNLGRGLPYLHPTMIVKKSVFEQIGFFNKNYKIAMDFDFVVRLVKKGYNGFYLKDKFVVKMEGTGLSVEREFDAIKECYKSLKENKFLNLQNSVGLSIRITLYFMRKIMVVFGLDSILRELKMRKHSRLK
jgi:glycosyltransferase involved in cell wall biosynthesis